MNDLFQALAAGGDVFTMAVCVMLYRLDKRVTDLEIVKNKGEEYGKA